MVLIGIGCAIVSGSDTIMFDGLYSLIHLIIALLTIYISKLVIKPSNDSYPFGYWMYEPMINLAKGLMIINLLALTFFNASSALYSGGNEVVLNIAVIYAALATLGCFFSAWVVGSLGKRAHSPLAMVDAKNWLVDGYISAAMLLVFIAAYLLQDTEWAPWIRFFDPIMVIVLVTLVVIVPLNIIRNAWNEIVGKHPGQSIEDNVRDAIESVVCSALHKGYRLRLTMTGRFLLVHVYFLIEASSQLDSIETLDELREQLYQALRKDYPFIAMDVIFTQQEKWQKMATGEGELVK